MPSSKTPPSQDPATTIRVSRSTWLRIRHKALRTGPGGTTANEIVVKALDAQERAERAARKNKPPGGDAPRGGAGAGRRNRKAAPATQDST